LARDIIDAAGDMAERIDYVMVDRSSGMRRIASENVPEARAVRPEQVETFDEGVVLAMELFDALPVHRIKRKESGLVELFVGIGEDGSLVELEGAPSEEVVVEAERYRAADRVGEEAEICTVIGEQLDIIDRAVRRGFLVILDYGRHCQELYVPSRARGTLLAYHRHATNEDYLRRVGEQDLTAHVNFTAVEEQAARRGWAVLGLTSQDRFLIANGILEQFEAADEKEWADPVKVKGRLQAMQLIHPQGMGRIFSVLILCRGLDPVPTLKGLADPFGRE
jgi:SAM-dependent MidA family methyltransferase